VTFVDATLPRTIGRGDMFILAPGRVQEEVLYLLSHDSATQVTLQTPVIRTHPEGRSWAL
jgi:hypothetical protein